MSKFSINLKYKKMENLKVECIKKPTGKGKLGQYIMPFEVGKCYSVCDTELDTNGNKYYLFEDIEIDGVLMAYVNSKYFKKSE